MTSTCSATGTTAIGYARLRGWPRPRKALETTNEDNVYEVTIVVTDGTYDMEGQEHRDELDVTVKVLNSTDDNEPGMVSFLEPAAGGCHRVDGYVRGRRRAASRN